MSDAAALRLALRASQAVGFEYWPDEDRFLWTELSLAERLFGATDPKLGGGMRAFQKRLSEDGADRREASLAALFASARDEPAFYRLEYQATGADPVHWIEESGSVYRDDDGRIRCVGLMRAIDDQRRREEELAELLSQDDLTGHLTRARLRAELDAKAQLAKDDMVYIVAGIDDLGAVNSDFGFDVADELIFQVGARLTTVMRDGDCIGRAAGNKFCLILNPCTPTELADRTRDIIAAVRGALVETKAGGIAASVSLGCVVLGDDVATGEIAMTRAEAALDEERGRGRASCSIFTPKTDVIGSRRRNSHLTDEILSALNERRVHVAFQPIVRDVGETPSSYECLVRLMRANGDIAPAGEIIGAAERLGLVHLLDRRVLELATGVLKRVPAIHLNLNVSWDTVKDPVWMDGYLAFLRANAEVAPRLTVELTETSAVDAVDVSSQFVSSIKEIGCHFAIDDFGAGYTSFRNLKAMDIDTLKIDGSFVTGVSESRDNQLFVRTLLDLARNFGVATVAEWVDNPSDALLLKGLGVDYLQGFFIGKPELRPEWFAEASTAPADAALRAQT
ncbi:MAG: bifunctional diguanylate cyclase/phosphodiesterase [Pseudomonadota bacterium]